MAAGLLATGSLVLPAASARAATGVDPLSVQGLELADGTLAAPPLPSVWGASAADPRAAEARLTGLRRELGSVWVAWDDARGAPAGIITAGVPAPGAITSSRAAEAHARAFLARHLELLAPGSAIGDFVVVGNVLSSGIRSVGLSQRHGGRPVVGGQISMHFKADSLAYVSSRALPRVRVPSSGSPVVSLAEAEAVATTWIADDFGPGPVHAAGTLELVVLPVWTGARWSYHEVVRVQVRREAPLGAWAVYLDARTGVAVAREQQLHSAVTVRFDVPVRWPGAARTDAIAPELYVSESGVPSTTDTAGQVAVVASPTTVNLGVDGPLVDVVASAGPFATASLPAVDGGDVVWSQAANELADAQLSAFVHTSVVKEHVRQLDPTLPWLGQQVQATVNLGGSCNAASDGDSIFFLQGNDSCENTARLADVVYHEVGHSVHVQSIIPGVGSFDSALSEGISDYLAATIVDDSGMGRGFNRTDAPLRELDPVGSEWTWPDDIAGVHDTGRIIGGTLWDLRAALMSTLGDGPGQAHADQLWYESIRRAVDIPSMYPQALLFDDDDGNLANGTPNGCEINTAFEAHGLLDPAALGDVSVSYQQVDEGRQVRLNTQIPAFPGCPTGVDGAELSWYLRGVPDDITTVPMVLDGGAWVATIPTQDTGVVVEHQVALEYSNGQQRSMPDNPADPWYQAFFGAVQPIYCLDDATDLSAWIVAGAGNNWSFGPLSGVSAVDPTEPWDADGVLLTQDGDYLPGSSTYAASPPVDVTGYDDVRLQYRRWLTVEDGFYDRATVYANAEPVWENLETEIHTVHHTDREWRFHDLPLGDFVVDDSVQVAFGIASDGGLEFGGWNVDGMCVVQVVEQVCGDGQVTGDELCDDGNTEDGDGCDAQCEPEPEPPSGTTGGDETSGDETGAGDGTSGGASEGDDGDDVDVPGGTGVDDGGTGLGDGASTGDTAGQDGPGASDGCGCVTAGHGGRPWRGAWWLAPVVVGLRRRR